MIIHVALLCIAFQRETEEKPLQDRSFLLEYSESFDPIKDVDIVLEFEDDMFYFDAACNTNSGEHTLEKDRFLENLFQ